MLGPRENPGNEPANARSAYGLRVILSVLFGIATAVSCIWLLVAAAGNDYRNESTLITLAVILGVVALLAVADLFVIYRRTGGRMRS